MVSAAGSVEHVELVGGADIVEELESTGELERRLRELLGEDYAARRDEQTVALTS